MKQPNTMYEELILIGFLQHLLGYTDERSVIAWCTKHSVPIIRAGKNKYLLSHYLTEHIDNQLLTFAKANFIKPEKTFLMQNVKVKDQERNKDVIEVVPKQKEIILSDAAQRFLNNRKIKK